MKSIVLSIIVVFFFSSCKTKSKIAEVSPDLVEFSMGKGACFGTCPVYSIEIYGGGKALFNGVRNTDKLGKYKKQLGELEYQALRERIASVNIDSFDNDYPSQIVDLPLITMRFRIGEELKVIKGKETRPEELIKIQNILENIAEGNDWEFIEGVEGQKEKEQYIISEIILEPGPGTLLPHFFKRMKESYGMSIKSQISPSQNLWLVTYDQNKVDGETLLKALKLDPEIKSAEFNKRVKPRGGSN